MDKRKATLTLAEKLNDMGYISLVTDPAVKSYLLSNATSVVLDLKKAGRIVTQSLDGYYFDLSKFGSNNIKRDSLPYNIRDYTTANYFFIEKYHDSSSSHLFATPAAIIGEAEERILREKFYKNVPEAVSKALDSLQLTSFIDAYSIYSSLKPDEALPLNMCAYRNFQNGEKVGLGDIVQGAESKRYYLVKTMKSDGSIEGYRFQDVSLKIPATGKKDDKTYGDCGAGYVMPVKKRILDINFFDFIFDLPYEDQNLEANKSFFKELSDSDSCRIMQKEYSQGKYFKEYFSVLGEERKKIIVEGIRSLPRQDPFLNSWLFNQGFDVKMSHLDLYKNDTNQFISYFKRSEKHVQELIVSDLFNCEYTNKEVIEFLEKEYSNLLRDVSFKNELSAESGSKENSNITVIRTNQKLGS